MDGEIGTLNVIFGVIWYFLDDISYEYLNKIFVMNDESIHPLVNSPPSLVNNL
jgi:hypothetical protein